eukprot:2627412-Amphidinium_carterae.1
MTLIGSRVTRTVTKITSSDGQCNRAMVAEFNSHPQREELEDPFAAACPPVHAACGKQRQAIVMPLHRKYVNQSADAAHAANLQSYSAMHAACGVLSICAEHLLMCNIEQYFKQLKTYLEDSARPSHKGGSSFWLKEHRLVLPSCGHLALVFEDRGGLLLVLPDHRAKIVPWMACSSACRRLQHKRSVLRILDKLRKHFAIEA